MLPATLPRQLTLRDGALISTVLQLKAAKSLQLLASTEIPDFIFFIYASAVKSGR